MRSTEHDIIVVGTGVAALNATLAAAENGASVLVLEKSSQSERGGNTRFTGGVVRFAHNGKQDVRRLVSDDRIDWTRIDIEPFPPQDVYAQVMENTHQRADPVLTKTWIDNSFETLLWMKEFAGVEFEFVRRLRSDSSTEERRIIYPRGNILTFKNGGVGLSNSLLAKIEKYENVEFVYDYSVRKLVKQNRCNRG